ncbi:carboxymuconolactone decarboxylase family protein [Nocardia huaxiensis]|uniref:Carboxymuconolactone decarboxylase family protein n=1 Tax=Nocardia huaxiensis TaxID=2755382 RepID=A0A7D6VE23_9NOCA|nr:carboxymuconolactone decarboxylase family protein [Nocardia huaxiensis]QLY30255.1 carboxymuconolactone decarboxylase family protein [Nocardia huaxiensis]UFS96122.1 carboxymuconolactone decarboxylase family protein [Nocardia huaxiensis]
MADTRIPAVSPQQAGLLTRLTYWYAKRRFGEVPEPFAVLANHPKLMRAAGIHETLVERGTKAIPEHIYEIAVYRVARTVGCSWCVDFGTMLMRLSELNVEKLQHIDDYATSPHYDEDERAAIAYADAMTATPPEVTDEQVTDLKKRFGTQALMELTYQIALENSRARTYYALGITDQGFSKGDACRVPWA